MVRQDVQRRLLYDMDTAITSLPRKDQAITLQGATDCTEVVQLTGCYHDLLQTWADS